MKPTLLSLLLLSLLLLCAGCTPDKTVSEIPKHKEPPPTFHIVCKEGWFTWKRGYVISCGGPWKTRQGAVDAAWSQAAYEYVHTNLYMELVSEAAIWKECDQ